MNEDCGACLGVTLLQGGMEAQATAIFQALSGPWAGLVTAAAGLAWLVYVGRCAMQGGFDIREAIGLVLVVELALAGITNYEAYKYWIYDPLVEAINVTGALIVGVGNGGAEGGSMVSAIEEASMAVVKVCIIMVKDMGMFNVIGYLMVVVLMVPYVAMIIIYAGYVVWAKGLLLIPLAFGPIFMGLGAFKPTRKFMVAGLDLVVLAAGFVLVASFWVGLVVASVQALQGSLPIDSNGNAVAGADTFLFGAEFWALLAVGWLCGGMMLFVPQMVSVIVGRPTSGGPVGAVLGKLTKVQ